MATQLMVRYNALGSTDQLGSFLFVEWRRPSRTEGSPSALFNYLLEVVLNRLCLCCLRRFKEAAC